MRASPGLDVFPAPIAWSLMGTKNSRISAIRARDRGWVDWAPVGMRAEAAETITAKHGMSNQLVFSAARPAQYLTSDQSASC
jgi:hypothetical protein